MDARIPTRKLLHLLRRGMRLPKSGGSIDVGEKRSDSGYILRTEPIGLVDMLGVVLKKRGFKDGSSVLGLNKWKDKVAIN